MSERSPAGVARHHARAAAGRRAARRHAARGRRLGRSGGDADRADERASGGPIPVNDVVEAIAARRAFAAGLRRHRPRALVFSTTTAALSGRDPGVPFAVWLDCAGTPQPPGSGRIPLHVLERRQLTRARVLMPHSPGAVAALPRGRRADRADLATGPAGADSAPICGSRSRSATHPIRRPRGSRCCARPGSRPSYRARACVIAGIPRERAVDFLARRGVRLPPGAELVGMLPQPSFRDLLSRARVFVSAAEWEDFGIAPLEAIDRGAALVCAPGRWSVPGPRDRPRAGARSRGRRP